MAEKYITSWEVDSRAASYPQLKEALNADVVIVGGGITGLLSAYKLIKSGKKVVVIEKNKIGSGATYWTTAFFTAIIDTNYSDIIRMLGFNKAKLIADSHIKAINLIEEIIRKENIDCDFKRCSNYIYSNKGKGKDSLEEECEALRSLGLDARLSYDGDLGFSTDAYIEIKNQVKLHPIKFIRALAEIIVKNGGQIFEDTEALAVEDSQVIRTAGGSVSASWIIIATHRPFNKPLGLHFKKALYVSYVLELEIPRSEIPEGLFEDTENPYHYFRVDRGAEKDKIVIGGEDHRNDIPMDEKYTFSCLKEYANKLFRDYDFKIVREWRGPILESVDGLAYIGLYKKPNMLYAMAFSGNGMTYSGIAALIFTDIAAGRKNPWESLYRVSRIPLGRLFIVKARDYLEILWNGVVRKALKI